MAEERPPPVPRRSREAALPREAADPERSDHLFIPGGVRIPIAELRLAPLRSGGPGGQNVNKVSNGVELRWDVRASRALDAAQAELALQRLGKRINTAGELVLRAVEFRERPRNVGAVLERLRELLAAALHRDRPRRPTRPTRGAQRRRRKAKERRSELKRARRSSAEE